MASHVHPEVFALYEQLVYTGAIPGRSRDDMYGIYANHGGCARGFQSLCELYILSDKLQDTGAKNAALSALIIKANEEHSAARYLSHMDKEKCFPPAEMITRMYEGTHEGSLGREFLADCYAYHASDLPKMLPPMEDVHMVFFRDIAMAALEKESSRRRTLLAEWYAEKPTPKPKGVVPFLAHRAPVSVTTSPHPSTFVRRNSVCIDGR